MATILILFIIFLLLLLTPVYLIVVGLTRCKSWLLVILGILLLYFPIRMAEVFFNLN